MMDTKLQALENEVEEVKAQRRQIKKAASANLKELDRILNGSDETNSEEHEPAVAGTVA